VDPHDANSSFDPAERTVETIEELTSWSVADAEADVRRTRS